MKYMVTGGRGFLGRHLVDFLVTEGHDVHVISHGESKITDNTKAHYISADIGDFNAIEKYFDGVDVVFHTAALAGTVLCIDDPVLCYKVNVMGSVNVLEASKKYGVKRVVLSSSVVVYGAETPYKYSKLAMEDIAFVYNTLYGVSTICLRYANIYGKNQDEKRKNPNVFASYKKSFMEKGFIEIAGDGEQVRDFIHVSDIVKANIVAAQSNVDGSIDICTGKRISLNYIVNELLRVPVQYIEERPGDVKETIQHPDEAFEKLGWKSEISIEDGIQDVVSDFQKINQG